MCQNLYIATNQTLNINAWKEDGIFHISPNLSNKEILGIRPKMENKNIYHLGAFKGCSCEFRIDEYFFEEEKVLIEEIDYTLLKKEKALQLKSIQKLLELIRFLSKNEDLEFYSCWHEDLNLPIQEKLNLKMEEITLEKNYFNLVERRKIIFYK